LTSDRIKPGLAFWATVVVVVVLVAYLLSFGPWCWIISRSRDRARMVPAIYRPIMKVAERSPMARSAIDSYAKLIATDHWILYGGLGSEWVWGYFRAG